MFNILTMCVRQPDIRAIAEQLAGDVAKLPDFFREPLMLDLKDVASSQELDLAELLATMGQFKLMPLSVCNANELQSSVARKQGVPVLAGGALTKRRPSAEPVLEEASPPPSSPAAPSAREGAGEIIDVPIRTGQRVFTQGDLTLLANVNPGAEVIAGGNIHVYGPLRGRALAGVGGDAKARIFTRCMEAELVAIAGCFRVLENDLSANVQGKPAQVFLQGERIFIEPL